MQKSCLSIDVLGASFEIQADESEEYLKSIYEYYKSVVDKLSKNSTVKDPLRLSIIAGILLTDEFFKERSRLDELPSDAKALFEIEQSAKRMIAQIDDVIRG